MQLTIPKEEYLTRKKNSQIKTGKSKTSQDKKNSVDINRIMARAKKNGILPDLNARKIIYADFANLPNYQDSLNQVIAMENEFMALPAAVRKKFDNDPAKLIEFVTDPANEDEAVELQLLPKPVIKTTKQETPDGDFWVTTKNGVEIKRDKVVIPAENTPAKTS